MIFISFGANAFNIGDLYKYCKPYQSNGFNYNELTDNQQFNALQCLSSLKFMFNIGSKTCVYLQSFYNSEKRVSRDLAKKLSFLSAVLANSSNWQKNINAVIASFNVFAENNSQLWNEDVTLHHDKFISNKFPCFIPIPVN